MPGRPRIEVEDKPERDLRKLARALLMLAEKQLKDDPAAAPVAEKERS